MNIQMDIVGSVGEGVYFVSFVEESVFEEMGLSLHILQKSVFYYSAILKYRYKLL